MAVICACIPSLRPLASVASQRFAHAPLMKTPLRFTNGYSSRGIWESQNSKISDGTFSQLKEPDDPRPLGHNTSIQGGRVSGVQDEVEGLEMPGRGISVRTEVILTKSDGLFYNDRLF